MTWAPDHERNDTLNRESFNIFAKYGVAGLLDPGEIATALKEAAMACGLRGVEIPRTLQSAWEGAERKPRSGELPSFVFEEPAATSGKPPSLARDDLRVRGPVRIAPDGRRGVHLPPQYPGCAAPGRRYRR